MHSLREWIDLLRKKTDSTLQGLAEADFTRCVTIIEGAVRIFIQGAGRSGLVGAFFATRLMHTGKNTYLAGAAGTPAIGKGDVLLVISGSGASVAGVHAAWQAKAAGALVLAVSARGLPAQAADFTVLLPAAGVGRADERVHPYPLGTIFEVSALLFLECVLAALIEKAQITERKLQTRHANLE